MILLRIFVILGFATNVYNYREKIEILTDNFFENLRGIPSIKVEKTFSDFSIKFIEHQISNYVKLVTGEQTSLKKKRSLLDKFTKLDKGIDVLKGVEALSRIPVRFPQDILLFQLNSDWFAAALESSDIQASANYLVVLIYEDEKFKEKARISIMNGVRIASIDFENSTILAVAENDAPKTDFQNKSGIYRFDGLKLAKIQSIDMHFASDIALWKVHNEIYLSVAQFMSNTSGNIYYEIEIPIYKWLGEHFDLMQSIGTKGTRKLTPFSLDHDHFLAVANFREDSGNTRIYSDIYKYDYHSEKFELYQKILTRACTDIQVFNLRKNRGKDVFLVVANSYETDSDGNVDYETDSIIYKLIDDYFIPFQSFRMKAIEQWLPFEGSNNEFVLFAYSRFDGLKSFQYDGWSFVEVTRKIPNILKGAGIKSLRSSNFKNVSLVVSNKNNNGKIANIFRLEFTHEKFLGEIYDEMITWCDHGLKKVEELNEGGVFEAILGRRADIEEEDENIELEEIDEKMNNLNSLLNEIKTEMETPGEITAEEIFFNNVTFVHNLNATTINNFKIDEFLHNTLNIDSGFELSHLNFSFIETEFLTPEKINGYDPKTLIHSTDDFHLNSVKINSLTVPEGVNIAGELNGISITKNLLQRVGDQNFSHPLTVKEMKVEKIVARSLNGRNLTTLRNDHVENLSVKNLTIGGYINDVDVPTLEKHALRKNGDQLIASEYIFDVLHGKNLEILGEISGKKLSDLIPINEDFSLNQNVYFKNGIFVNDLIVSKSLNELRVEDGKLDILVTNSSEEQEIIGDKIFGDVIVHRAITLQGHIDSQNLERMKPVVAIDDNIFLEGDKVINEVLVEGIVNVKNVVTPGGTYSLVKLDEEGLRLDSKQVQPHLFFVQQLNLHEIFVDDINGKNPRSFVVTGNDDTQTISGVKTFLGDLNVEGSSTALKINNVLVEELEGKVLKIEGDQTIVGKHHIKQVIADKITTNLTKFDTDFNAKTKNISIDDDLRADFVKASTMFVQGFTNDLHFDKIVDDTVAKDSKRLVEGHKFFENVSFGELNVETGIDIEIPDKIDEIRFEDSLIIDNIEIENLYFGNECNGVFREDFGDSFNENVTVDGQQEFDRIVVYGRTYIESKKINDVGIDDLAENSVKIDEPLEFDSAFFESVVVSQNFNLEGDIENLDFDNLILYNETEATIFDEKIFKNNLTINGSIHFKAFINDLNMTQFCKFTMGEMEEKNVTIDGNIFFVKGPKISKINNLSMKEIMVDAWFSDEDTTLTGSVNFEDVTFNNDILVGGFVDNISVSLLYENYFSKSKDQKISAIFNFENDLFFENNITVPKIVTDIVNGINIEEFVRTAILDDYDQVFETVVFFERCLIENLTGEYTVNGLDLDKDIMRFDRINMVTGTKIFNNLNIDHLKLNKDIKIQEVDVLDWFKHSVLKTTSFNITGTKEFKNVIFSNGFQLLGTLNSQKFNSDNIMLRDFPQEITGRKIIYAKPLNPVLFKGLKLKGLLNGVEISDLINNQAYKNRDNVFKTRMNLFNNITTNNLIIKKSYENMNMTELIVNVKDLGILNNLLDQFEKVLDMSHKLKESIQNQAYFLHQYKIIQTITATNSRIIKGPDGIIKIGVLVRDSGTKMNLYGWYERQHQFLKNATIHFGEDPEYVDQVLMGQYLYTEGHDGSGLFIDMSNPTMNTIAIETNTTISTTSFVLPTTNEPCTLFIYFQSNPRIYCKSNKENGIQLRQILTFKSFEASSITINGTLYLIIITQPIKNQGSESRTDLWSLNNQTSEFELEQSMFEAYPKSVSTISYRNSHYLAIASGHVQNSMCSGRVEIRIFTNKFVSWQSLDLDAPIQVQFAILPSDELVLYVLTDNPTEPLLVYRYEGIAGFKSRVVGSVLPRISYLNQFVGGAGQHFLVAQSNDEINIIQAIFKGERVE